MRGDGRWTRSDVWSRAGRMAEGLPELLRVQYASSNCIVCLFTTIDAYVKAYILVCIERGGPTPFHPEPGRETSQRHWYWRIIRWESRSMRLC